MQECERSNKVAMEKLDDVATKYRCQLEEHAVLLSQKDADISQLKRLVENLQNRVAALEESHRLS